MLYSSVFSLSLCGVRACVCACLSVCLCLSMRACVCVCVRAYIHVAVFPTYTYLPDQFNQFMKVIGEMLKKVEVEQKAHLEQLSKMEEQTK